MLANTQVLATARALFQSDGVASCHLADGFTHWHGCLHYVSALKRTDHPALLHVQNMAFDFWTLLTVAYRTDWQAQLPQDVLPAVLWREFIGSDVEHFHTTLRSLCDHAAAAIAVIAHRPGQVPDSFERLRSWAAGEPRASAHLGDDLLLLLRSCDWFQDIRRVRDLMVHGKSLTVGFVVDRRPCFQLVAAKGATVLEPGLMANPNVVDFRLYAAAALSHLLVFLDGLGRIGLSRLSPDHCPESRSAHYGLATILSWMDALLAALGAA